MNVFNPYDLVLLGPELILMVTAFAVLLADLGLPRERKHWNAAITLAGLVAASLFLAGLAWTWPGGAMHAFSRMMVLDGYGHFVKMVILGATIFSVLISLRYLRLEGIYTSELFTLILLSSTGMMVLTSGNDLLTIYLGLELMSLASYVLTAFLRSSFRSIEAGVKYFLLGGFSSALMLYGISLIYGMTGSTQLDVIGMGLSAVPASPPLIIAVLFLLAGFAFKVSAVPFHLWTPDVYQGGPTPIVAYMSIGTKAASIAAFARLFLVGFGAQQASIWAEMVVLLAVLSVVLGNAVAVVQTNVKRMLAYSTIAHAGYMLVALVVAAKNPTGGGLPDGLTALLFYLFGYMFANIGAFAVVIYLGREGQHEQYHDFSGLAQTRPWVAAVMMVFLLSLTGLPPTVGFVGKLYIFGAAIEAGYTGLALIGLLMSAVSLYYYMGLAMYMYMRPPLRSGGPPFYPTRALAATLVLCAVACIFFGLFPGTIVEWARQGVMHLGR
jgi:NADH-quinone oxidoreductase subunit N